MKLLRKMLLAAACLASPGLAVEVSRLEVDHPALGTAGGSALHTQIEAIYVKIGDNMDSRWVTGNIASGGGTLDVDHNLKTAFGDLKIVLYSYNTGSGESTIMTPTTAVDLDNFPVIARVGFETTQIRITNNSGSAEDIAVLIMQGHNHFNDLGIGEAVPAANLHLKDVDVGAFTPAASQLIIENDNSAISLISSASGGGDVLFGDPSDTNEGGIHYEHSGTPDMRFTVAAGEVMRMESGNVGIGETVPLGKLHVKTADSGSAVDAAADEFVIENNNDAGITVLTSNSAVGKIVFGETADPDAGQLQYFQGDDSMRLFTDSGERVRIIADGSTGIGETAPLGTLHVRQAASSEAPPAAGDDVLIIEGTNAGMTIVTGSTEGSNIVFGDVDDINNGFIHYEHSGVPDMRFIVNTAEIMRMESGNVGIGETVPLGKLHVRSANSGASSPDVGADELILEGSGDSGMTIMSGTSGAGNVNFSDTSARRGFIQYGHGAPDSMSFGTANVSRFSIDNTGVFAWNGTSDTFTDATGYQHNYADDITFELDFDDDNGGIGAVFAIQDGTGDVKFSVAERGDVAFYIFAVQDASETMCSSTGGVGDTRDIGACSSSIKFKQDVVSQTQEDVDRLYKLNPVRFNWKKSGRPDYGFIAEEAFEVIPELVTWGEDKETKETSINGFNYRHLTSVIVAAMKDLKSENDMMKAWICSQDEAPARLCG